MHVTQITGLLAVFLGIAVLLGWYFKNAALITVLPDLPEMQHNTALGFLFSGLGLFFAMRAKVNMSSVFGTVALLIGWLTLFQYAFNINLGIDELVVKDFINVEDENPGRMAINTAICFIMSGGSIILMSKRSTGTYSLTGTEILALFILALSVTALIGHITQSEFAYGWGKSSQMAMHTSVGFTLIGVGLFAGVGYHIKSPIASIPLWIPFLLGVGVMYYDLRSPLGVAAGVGYIPLVICSYFFRHNFAPLIFALVSTLLIVIGYYSSPQLDIPNTYPLINRILSVAGVWTSALIMFYLKKSQEKLLEKETRVQHLMDSSLDGLITVSENGEILSVNKSAADMLDYTEDEMIGSSVNRLVPDQWTAIHGYTPDGQIDPVILAGLDKVSDLRVRRKSGHRLEVEMSLTRTQIGHKTIISGLLRDITIRKDAEDRLAIAMGQLEASNVELEKFAYVASHDLKSPLRAIDNLSKWMEEDLGDTIDEENKGRIKKMRERVQRMENLLNGLLEYSQAGHDLQEAEVRSAHSLVVEAKEVLDVPKGFKVKIDDTLKSIDIPKMPVQQVFHNLINNALKHHGSDTGLITVSGRDIGDDYEFTVDDDGQGIKPEFHSKIFEMFQTLRPRDQVEGSGMGLALVKKLLGTYGGDIRVESTPGKGAKFVFLWPKTPSRTIKGIDRPEENYANSSR